MNSCLPSSCYWNFSPHSLVLLILVGGMRHPLDFGGILTLKSRFWCLLSHWKQGKFDILALQFLLLRTWYILIPTILFRRVYSLFFKQRNLKKKKKKVLPCFRTKVSILHTSQQLSGKHLNLQAAPKFPGSRQRCIQHTGTPLEKWFFWK